MAPMHARGPCLVCIHRWSRAEWALLWAALCASQRQPYDTGRFSGLVWRAIRLNVPRPTICRNVARMVGPHTALSVRAKAWEMSIAFRRLAVVAVTPASSEFQLRESAFQSMLSRVVHWSHEEGLSIALRSAMVREISTAIISNIEYPASVGMLDRTQKALLRAGIDS